MWGTAGKGCGQNSCNSINDTVAQSQMEQPKELEDQLTGSEEV